MPLDELSLDDLIIDDAASFAHVELYQRLREVVRHSGHLFQIPKEGSRASWDRVLFLNLTYWSPHGADVLCDRHLPADVVAHVAWHHLVTQELSVATGAATSAAALLFAESIASAFDLYLVGRLLGHAPDSDFISTQVPILTEVAEVAGLSPAQFSAMLDELVRDPERGFEDLRALLFDAASALLPCRSPSEAQDVLAAFEDHRFHALLHHFQMSNWILYCRAWAVAAPTCDAEVRRLDGLLRQAPVALDWLAERWMPDR